MKKLKQQFGGKISPELEAQFEQSPNWKEGKFENLEETSMSISFWEIPELLYKQFTNKAEREPSQPIPILPFDKDLFLAAASKLKFAWYGHSALLMRMASQTLLIDPMLGPNASPIAPFQTKRFSENTLDVIDSFPEIDLMLITHDHYDHLDYDSIMNLKDKTKRYFVAMGVKRHLVKWGIDAEKITEFDWWDADSLADISITFTPTRHFSGRGLTDRAKSLWGGWVFETAEERIWFSGDGGYGDHFQEVAKRFGSFDFAFMECGQYNEKWRPIHMFPDESVQAAVDTHVKRAMPVHWAGFSLAQHSWTEPVEEFVKHCQAQQMAYVVPRIGEIMDLSKEYKTESWWEG